MLKPPLTVPSKIKWHHNNLPIDYNGIFFITFLCQFSIKKGGKRPNAIFRRPSWTPSWNPKLIILLCLVCLPGVSWLWCGFPRGAMLLSAVCDCGISWSYSLTFLLSQSRMVLAYPSNPPLSPPFSTHQVQPTVFGTCHKTNPAYFVRSNT